jgi:hypothetical protein
MNNNTKTCPTCGQRIKPAGGAGAVFINRNGIVTKRFIAGFNDKEFLEEVDKIVR